MKNIFISFCLLPFFIVSCGKKIVTQTSLHASSAGFCVSDSAIVYGENDIGKVFDDDEIAGSVASMISSSYVIVSSQDERAIFGDDLTLAKNICAGEVEKTISVARCSSFLVGEDLLMTAAHCLDENSNFKNAVNECQNHRFIFDFNDQKFKQGSDVAIIETDNIYNCKELVDYRLNANTDYAIIRLDRKVEGRKPLLIAKGKTNVKDLRIKTYGFPLGAPMRVSLNGRISGISKTGHWLHTKIDSFEGNSGGPVVDEATGHVIGIHTHGIKDALEFDELNQCNRVSKRCLDENNCEDSKAFNLIKVGC